MKKLLLFLLPLLCSLPAGAQGIVGYVSYVASAPSGVCLPNSNAEIVVGLGTIYTCQNAAWAQASGGGGSGTVTSVTFTGDGIFDSSTPSTAVTTSGPVSATVIQQAANCVFAGPASGSAANPSCRALVALDLPLTLQSGTTLVAPALGTPASGVITNLTGTCTSCGVGGNAATATNMSGGTIGQIPYQSAANTSAFLAANTAATDQVLVSHGSGSAGLAPTLNNAPALSAANMTAFPASVATAASVTALGCSSACSYMIAGDTWPSVGPGPSAAFVAENIHAGRFFNTTQKKLGATGCINVTTLFSGGHIDVGVYSISGTTLTLQWHIGGVSTTSTGGVCGTSLTPYTMTAGTDYYLASCADDTTALFDIIGSAPIGNNYAGTSATANTYGKDTTDECTSGVLPNTMTTTNITNATTINFPFVLILN